MQLASRGVLFSNELVLLSVIFYWVLPNFIEENFKKLHFSVTIIWQKLFIFAGYKTKNKNYKWKTSN